MSIDLTKPDWLIRIGSNEIGPGGYVHLYPIGRLTAKDVQAAADAQYGKGSFRFMNHGTVIFGYDNSKFATYRKAQEERRNSQ